MAPEIVRLEPHRSEEELDALRRAGRPLYGTAVDIWSLGCVAVEVLFGVPLFSARSGAHGPDCELDAELEAKIADEAPVRLLERTRARRRLSPAAVEFVEVRRTEDPPPPGPILSAETPVCWGCCKGAQQLSISSVSSA